jgi:hypothetical protein
LGDTTNWEFAAAVSAICIGLGGLLLFTIVGAIGSWRIFNRAGDAAAEAHATYAAVQDLARTLSAAQAGRAYAGPDPQETERSLTDLRQQVDALVETQSRMQDLMRDIVAMSAPGGDTAAPPLRELEAAVRRLEQEFSSVAAAVANLSTER